MPKTYYTSVKNEHRSALATNHPEIASKNRSNCHTEKHGAVKPALIGLVFLFQLIHYVEFWRLTKCHISFAVQGAVGSITRCNCHDENEGTTIAVGFNFSQQVDISKHT